MFAQWISLFELIRLIELPEIHLSKLYIPTVEALTSELLIKTPTIINGDMVNKANGDKSPILQIKKIDSYLTRDCVIDYKGNLECQAQK